MKSIGSRRNIISHSNQLTEARYTLTVAEQRLVITLLSLISPNDEDFKDYEIKISDFKNLLGINTNAVYDQVKEVLKKIAGRVLHIPTENGYIITHWFSSAEYNSKNGSVQISLDKKLKPYLLQLKEQFTRYKLFIITQFQSSYTVRIYMLLKQYEIVGYREIDVLELREILDIDDKKYPLFKDFRKWVLNKVKKELETKSKATGGYNSDITFNLETIRTGRKITRLRFIIKKQAYQEALPLDLPELETQSHAVHALMNHGISETLAKTFEKEQDEADILRCVQLYEEQLKAGKVENKGGGYLLSMLKAEAGKQTTADRDAKERQEKQAEKIRKEERQKRKDELSSDFLRIERKAFLAALNDEEENQILGEVLEKYKGDSTVSGMVRRNGLDTMMIASDIVKRIPDFEKKRTAYIKKNIAPNTGFTSKPNG